MKTKSSEFKRKFKIIDVHEVQIEPVMVRETDYFYSIVRENGDLRRFHKASWFGRKVELYDSRKQAMAMVKKRLRQQLRWAKNDIKSRMKAIRKIERSLKKAGVA